MQLLYNQSGRAIGLEPGGLLRLGRGVKQSHTSPVWGKRVLTLNFNNFWPYVRIVSI